MTFQNFIKSISLPKMIRIESFLQSTSGMFCALVMVLAFSTPNTTEVLTRINRIEYMSEEGIRILALSFAIVLEFIILILACIGQSNGAKFYAVASFMFHSLYYRRWNELLLIPSYDDPILIANVIADFVASLLTSGMISGSIWYFSEQFYLKLKERYLLVKISDLEQKVTDLQQNQSDLQLKLTDSSKELREIEQKIKTSQQTVEDLQQEKKKSRIITLIKNNNHKFL